MFPGDLSHACGQFPILKYYPVRYPFVFGANSRGEGDINGLGVVDVTAEDGLEVAVGAEVDYVGFA